MPEIVCNTTPLQYLHQADVLEILPALYGRVLIPQAVADEIAVGETVADWRENRLISARKL